MLLINYNFFMSSYNLNRNIIQRLENLFMFDLGQTLDSENENICLIKTNEKGKNISKIKRTQNIL